MTSEERNQLQDGDIITDHTSKEWIIRVVNGLPFGFSPELLFDGSCSVPALYIRDNILSTLRIKSKVCCRFTPNA